MRLAADVSRTRSSATERDHRHDAVWSATLSNCRIRHHSATGQRHPSSNQKQLRLTEHGRSPANAEQQTPITQNHYIVLLLWHNKDVYVALETSIHRHQTPPQYHHNAHGRRRMVQPPRFSIAPIMAKCDVIHKTGST